MNPRYLMAIVWPAFLVAAVLEIAVFALVDPHELHWLGAPLEMPRNAVYTMAFFGFWAAAAASSALSLLLTRSSEDLNAAGEGEGGSPGSHRARH
ncbi:MAG: hypothetical protein MUF76_02980 [Hydrogenophaga sp.]|jgi:hypothetical protein|nr:hypothetical protein [Hydrogenophaga sp.]